jgi:hypothetical protein
MNESRLPDDAAFDDLLRRSAPGPLADRGFTARTMAAVERAARAQPVRRRAPPPSPLAIARALAMEQGRHDAQARLWRWATAGVVAGYLLMMLAIWLSPQGSVAISIPTPGESAPLALLLMAGAIWVAVREWRAA